MVYAVWIGRFINCLENNNSLNMEDSIVTQLADRLKDYKNINLNESFSMVRYDCPVLSEREQEILRERDAFPRQLELKRMVGDKLAGSFENRIVNEVDSSLLGWHPGDAMAMAEIGKLYRAGFWQSWLEILILFLYF